MMQTDLLRTELSSSGPAPVRQPGSELAPVWLDGGWAVLDSRGRILEWNESLRSWLEGTGTVDRAESFWNLLRARSPNAAEALEAVAESDQTFNRLTLCCPSPQSTPAVWVRLEATHVGAQHVIRLNSVLPPAGELAEATWDEHLQSESARRDMFVRLLRAETQLDSLTHRWPGVIFSQRPDLSFRFASAQIEALTGISVADWQRQTHLFWQLVHESDVEELQHQFQRAMRTGKAITSTYRIRHPQTGRVAYILEHRQPTLSRNGLLLGYEGVWLDVTRQTIAERRLSSAAWKETLAVLTLGMAHDFGNIMAGIHSLAESFLAQVEPAHPFHEGLTLIKKNALQASQLVNRMVNLHLGQTGDRNYHNLNEVAADLVELVRKVLPRRVSIETDLSSVPLPIYADVVEFRQVILNLALNAADAMPKGGTLTLQTSGHEELPAFDHYKGVRPRQPAVCLTVQDTGCGIKARHLATIFDPFFTTKATHQGSGLGLYNAGLFVEKHQGCISVESTEGTGATFGVWLPQADFSEAERQGGPRGATPLRRRTLLLAGRDGEMLERMAETLRSHSFYVVVAGTPDAASDFLTSGEYQFDGVLLLAEMNDVNFHEFFRDAHPQARSGLKTIIVPVGCDQEALDQQWLARADLLFSADTPQPEFIEKLKMLFAAAA